MTDEVYGVLALERRWMRLNEIARGVGCDDLAAVRAALAELAAAGRVDRYQSAADGERPLWGANLERLP